MIQYVVLKPRSYTIKDFKDFLVYFEHVLFDWLYVPSES